LGVSVGNERGAGVRRTGQLIAEPEISLKTWPFEQRSHFMSDCERLSVDDQLFEASGPHVPRGSHEPYRSSNAGGLPTPD
jgi:hypothetical protein